MENKEGKTDKNEDILEFALNNGIKAASEKYEISMKETLSIVRSFQRDIEDLCDCEKARLNGIAMLCFVCTGGKRIKL